VVLSNYKKQVGSFGQNLAGQFLQKRNYKIIRENFAVKEGEIDIICEKDDQLIFVEVKTRLSENFGLPEEAVNDAKKEKIYIAALKYLEQEQINHDNFRFDCLAVLIDKVQKKATIRHYKNIINDYI
jgi:putative endonuclease